ncbi:MAG TPA: cysteine hydrolase [Chloroflexi bacterium]|nr:cysteine hydrolase [Chloroflexota bacterium]
MNTKSDSFLDWLADWEANLSSLDLATVVVDPTQTAVLSVDMLVGFCYQGSLASPRAAGIIPDVVHLFQDTHAAGIRHFLLLQDTHEADAVEFSAYPPHSVAGSEESETIEELRQLPFSDLYTVMPKNSVSCDLGTELGSWLEAHPEVNTFIVVGVCTDICVYQLAMYLRLRANVLGQRDVRVIVPANCVQTYDMPVETAEQVGALPHSGDLLHRVFLYHMALNKIEIVAGLI